MCIYLYNSELFDIDGCIVCVSIVLNTTEQSLYFGFLVYT